MAPPPHAPDERRRCPPPARSDHGRACGRARPPRGSGRPREGGSRSPRASERVLVYLLATAECPTRPSGMLKRTSHVDVLVDRTELRSIAPNPVTVVDDVLADLDTARLPCSRKSARRSCSSAACIGIDEYARANELVAKGEATLSAGCGRAPCERAPPGTGRRLPGRPQRRALRPRLSWNTFVPSIEASSSTTRLRSGRRSIRAAISAWIVEGSGMAWDLGRRPAALATSRDLGRRASRATPRRRADCRRTFG